MGPGDYGIQLALQRLSQSTRFQVGKPLGDGGYGAVFEAEDRQAGHRVALKVLTRADPDSLLNFKREFRAAQDVVHPNLVHLYDLFEQSGVWFFTMELIEGVDLLDYVRQGDVPELDRIRKIFAQLALGLSALHAQGFVHRDVKPTNVRVTPEGRAVLLDFGLVRSVSKTATFADAMGTAAYMAPEQVDGARMSPAIDAYALGASLYEALIGEPPFVGGAVDVLIRKQKERVAPLHLRHPQVPTDLSELVEQLLRPDPSERPGLDRVVEVCLGERLLRASSAHEQEAPFVGRETERGELSLGLLAARAGGLSVIVVSGPSGVGKTELVRAFAAHALDAMGIYIEGRAREHMSLPFNALDEAVDGLSRALLKLPKPLVAEVLPERAARMTTLFPVLARVPLVTQQRWMRAPTLDPEDSRQAARRGLAAVFEGLARRRPTLLFLDDFQWADDDSLALLIELMERRPALCLVIAVRKPNALRPPISATIARLSQLAEHRATLALGNLSPEEAHTLAVACLPRDEERRAEWIVTESGGHPGFIMSLSQSGAPRARWSEIGFGDAIASIARELDMSSRAVLCLVCLAPRSLRSSELSALTGFAPESVGRILAVLRARKLVHSAGVPDDPATEPYHDLVRSAVLSVLPSEESQRMRTLLDEALR